MRRMIELEKVFKRALSTRPKRYPSDHESIHRTAAIPSILFHVIAFHSVPTALWIRIQVQRRAYSQVVGLEGDGVDGVQALEGVDGWC